MFITAFFCLPETLYIRKQAPTEHQPEKVATTADQSHIPHPSSRTTRKTYLLHLKPWSHYPQLHLRANQFIIPALKMAKYPSVVFPAFYYATMYGFASILPAVTVAAIFTEFFHWNTLTIGLTYGGSLTIGSILGEAVSGWVVDLIVKRKRARLGHDPPPEVRLIAIWAGEAIVPAGLLIYGFCLAYHTAWIAPILGMGIACFGLQMITTVCYTYAIDCYRVESAEVAQLFNFIRQVIGFTFAFYVVDFGAVVGYQFVFLFFALVGGLLAFIPMLLLLWKGREWRERLGKPVGVNVFDSMLDVVGNVKGEVDLVKEKNPRM